MHLCSLISRLLLDESSCSFFGDARDVADLVLESDTVELVGALQEFRAEGGRDELGILGQPVDHGCMERRDGCHGGVDRCHGGVSTVT